MPKGVSPCIRTAIETLPQHPGGEIYWCDKIAHAFIAVIETEERPGYLVHTEYTYEEFEAGLEEGHIRKLPEEVLTKHPWGRRYT